MTGGKFEDVKGALLAAVKRAGLPKITWHMFQHTFASRLTRDGVDIVTVKELPGHSNISTTMRYAHSNDETKRRAVARLRTSENGGNRSTEDKKQYNIVTATTTRRFQVS